MLPPSMLSSIHPRADFAVELLKHFNASAHLNGQLVYVPASRQC